MVDTVAATATPAREISLIRPTLGGA